MCSAVSAALAVARAVQRAMRYASSRRRSRAAVLVPSRCQPAVPIASGPVTETTRRQQPSPARGSARLGRGEVSSAPDAVAARFFWPLQMARGRPTWQAAPSAQVDWDPTPPMPPGGVFSARRRRGVASAEGGQQRAGVWPHRHSRVRTASAPRDTARHRRVDESCTAPRAEGQRPRGGFR